MYGHLTATAAAVGKVHLKVFNFEFPTPMLSLLQVCGSRRVHTQALTKNLQFITHEKVDVKIDPQTMKLTKDPQRPICIMLNWLLAPRKLTLKYAELYLREGFDVLSVSIRPWQLMWPRRGSQMIGRDILRVMAANDNHYMVHGFSVGGYVWSEALVHATKDLHTYQPVLDRVSAQVWDSVADLTAVAAGVPLALYPTRPLMQNALKGLVQFYLLAFHYIATRHYALASATYYATPCRAPCLFLLSSTDHVGAEANIRDACQAWRNLGIECTLQCWKDSPHVSHYTKHREEYVQLLRAHILRHSRRDKPITAKEPRQRLSD